MAKAKKVVTKKIDLSTNTLRMTVPSVVPTTIEKVSIDYGREDLNNIAKKVNEIIDHLNK